MAPDRLIYRLVMAVDVEGYSGRDARGQLFAQTGLRRVLTAAALRAGLDPDQWEHQLGGDGELAILPENVDVAQVVGEFTRALEAELRRLNRRPERRPLRIRIALHHGTLIPGPFGPAGNAPIVVSRLLDAPQLRRQLATEVGRHSALVISTTLFRDVVETGFCSLDVGHFQPIRFVAKRITYTGYIYRR